MSRARSGRGPVRRKGKGDLENAEQLRQLVEQMPAVLWSTDGELRFTSFIGAARSGLTLDPRPSIGMSLYEFFGATDADARPIAAHQKALRGESVTYEGEWWGRALHVRVEPLRNRDGSITGAVGAALDITERKKAEEALKESEERYRILFERNLAGVFRSTLDGRILDCNDACLRIFGYETREEFMARPAPSLFSDPAGSEELIARLREHGEVLNEEIPLRRREGQPIWVLQNVSLVPARGGQPDLLVGTLVDITDRKRAEEQIVYQAYHDSLTGLPNRRLLEERLSVAVSYARRARRGLSVLYLDLDHFKLINDTLGHPIGDRLLEIVAKRLKECEGDGDTIARMGGDEFTMLLSMVGGAERAAEVARNLLGVLERPVVVDGHQLFVTASIGIALFPSDGEDSETLMKNADNAMYRAKEVGRNTFQLCTAELNRRATERLAIENGLRHAPEREELVVHYQPFYATATRRVVGVEALLRWQRPGRGLMLPEDFVGVAEESRLIFTIGEWVLATACRHVREWHERGFPDLRVAVNLSMRQFQQPGLVEVVSRALEKARLEPRSLDLEITESIAMQDVDRTLSVLADLRKIGVGLAMDDFGTGHASLSYLTRLPIQKLKIDRSFVTGIMESPEKASIVETIVSMARGLGLGVIAEGVEDEAQFDFLKRSGCHEVQGFWLSVPLEKDAFEKLLDGMR